MKRSHHLQGLPPPSALAALWLAVALHGCGGNGSGGDKKDSGSKDAAADVSELDGQGGDLGDGVDGGSLPDSGADEAGGIADAGAEEVVQDGAGPEDSGAETGGVDVGHDAGEPDGGPVDAGPECAQASDCAGKVSPRACEQPACKEGKCVVELKAESCCENSHCDDAKECTIDTCVQATHSCEHKNIPNCCSGKLTLHKADFEGGFEGLIAKEAPGNGNVAWKVDDRRAHKGHKALHFANACGTYDNSRVAADGCTSTGKATAVSGSLSTKAFALPADKQTQLRFWLYADVEPMYADSLPKGTCATPCKVGRSCVNINGTSQCLPEQDVLQLKAIGSKSGTVTLFDSTSIGKSTRDKDGKPAWRRVLVDLDKLRGENVRLIWTFRAATGFKNDFEGVYIDSVVLETVCAVQGTLCGPSAACIDDANPCTSQACSLYANNAGSGICFFDPRPGCCTNADQCDDGKPCTIDACHQGNCSNTPDTSKAGCCKPAVLLSDDFDSGVLSGWTLSGNSQLAKWRLDPSGGEAKSQALYFGVASYDSYDDPTLGKGLGPKGRACSKAVVLQPGTVFNMVQFRLAMETEFSYLPASKYKNPPLLGKPKYDFLSVTALEAGKSHELWTSDLIYGTTEGEWIDVIAPIPAKLQGQSVQVCLNFQAGDDQVNDKEGVHIDKFLVRVTCQKKSCYFDAQCAAQSCSACETPGCTDKGCGCKPIAGCCAADKDCDDGKPCTADQCIDHKCTNHEVENCCTADSQCTALQVCDKPVCDPSQHVCKTEKIQGCCAKDSDCEDFDPCTLPKCDPKTNACSFTPIQGCCKQDSECDDKDKCTIDNCIDGKCYYKPSGAGGCG